MGIPLHYLFFQVPNHTMGIPSTPLEYSAFVPTHKHTHNYSAKIANTFLKRGKIDEWGGFSMAVA